jgi:thiol:disulfide interchange protein DsbD
MIPITVSFFTKRAEKEKGKGLRDASIYALGIIFTFTALGFLLALIFGATGIRDFAANGWVNLFIAAIFIIFALNLFGAFEIQLPTGLMNKLNSKSQSGTGIVSVLLMGLTFSLTSFTCTVPFVGSALISASGGEWFYPIIGMLGFSAVFAAPFFLLALFPSALTTLPKAGGWMNNVKVVMGFLEVAAAIKFISNADLVWAWGILPREMFLSIWIACGFFIVFYVLGKFRLPHDSPVDTVGSPRIVFSVIFASITIWLITGLFGKPLGELDAFLPPPDYEMITGSAAVSNNLSKLSAKSNENDFSDWYKNYDEAIAVAKDQNKALFIDFTGFTCTNCRLMETNMFPRASIKSKMDEMVKVKLFTDRREEPYLSNKKFQEERFGSIELPLYVILTPDGELIGTKSFTRNEEEFSDFLQKGLDAVNQGMAKK